MWLRRFAWMVGLTAGLWFTAVVPVGRPRGPGLLEPVELWRWLPVADPASAVMATVRLACGVALTYLLIVSTLLALAEAIPAFGRLANTTTPHFARRLVGPAMGLTAIVVTPDLAQVESAREATAPDTATLVLLDDPGAAGDTEPGQGPAPTRAVATMVWIGPTGSTGPLIDEAVDALAPLGHHDVGPSTWVVKPGDHFWSIAERTLDRMPDGTGLQQHWRRLIELNRDRLPDRNNPDLILPGMHLRLP